MFWKITRVEARRLGGRRGVFFSNTYRDALGGHTRRAPLPHQTANVIIHAHCHALTMNAGFMKHGDRLPARKTTLLDTGCCVIREAFGALASQLQLALKVAEPL